MTKRIGAWLGLVSLAVAPPAMATGRAEEILGRFWESSGGLAGLRGLSSVSVTATIDALGTSYTLHLLADGRFRTEAADRTTVYDGRDYWQSYYGVVAAVTEEEELARLREISLQEVCFHGLMDASGHPVALEHVGSELVRGRRHELLATTRPDGRRRTYYFDAETGLLTKIVELVPDTDLRELKNICTMADYRDCGGLRLPATFQILCVTTGDETQPLTRFSDCRLNQPVDEQLFARPTSGVPPVALVDGWLVGQVAGISGRGSLITSITRADLAGLGVADPPILIAEAGGRQTRHRLSEDMQGVSSGDYVATFNRSPVLWLVKAFVGMTSDHGYAVGDQVRLTVARDVPGEEGR